MIKGVKREMKVKRLSDTNLKLYIIPLEKLQLLENIPFGLEWLHYDSPYIFSPTFQQILFTFEIIGKYKITYTDRRDF